MKNKKEIFKLIGIIFGGFVLMFISVMGIIHISNKSHKNETVIYETIEESGISLRKNKIAKDTDTIHVFAEVMPTSALDKTLEWSVSWATPDDYNKNYNINDYIQLTVSTDTLDCIVKVLKPLISQGLLTCKSSFKPNIKSTCTIDYICKDYFPKGATFTGTIGNLTWKEWKNHLTSSVLSGDFSNGTVNPTIQITQPTSFNIASKYQCLSYFLTSSYNDMKAIEVFNLMNQEHGGYNLLQEMGQTVTMFTFNYDMKYGDEIIKSGTATAYFYLNYDLTEFSLTSVSLDESELYF